ncbi:unnamed protein product, partial [Didymodactylos carnosus]
SKRTLEGSLAGLLTQFFFVIWLWAFDIIPYTRRNLILISTAITFSSQMEAFSRDIDNLTLPICLFPFLYMCDTTTITTATNLSLTANK